MTTFGLIPMSAKPFHLGHAALIALASRECDEVKLYVSLSDRVKPDEAPVYGADMATLWQDTIAQTMPANVEITYGGSPITNIWKELGAANEGASQDSYVIYSDPVDLSENFPQDRLTKYCDDLYARGNVRLRPVERASTIEISGTKMREYLKAGDKAGFIRYLPNNLDKNLCWDVLLKGSKKLPVKHQKFGGGSKKDSPPPKKG